jgi:hypothetical protein
MSTAAMTSYYTSFSSSYGKRRPTIDLRDAHVASYILSVAERGYSVTSFAESVNSLENSTVRNAQGRIVKLKLDYDTQDETAPLASEIEQLEMLENLELWGCKQLPATIGHLLSMESLKLIRCFGLQSLPSTPNMKRLSHLSINSLPHANFCGLIHHIGHLPSLEILALNYVNLRSSDIEALLLQKDNAFRDTLCEINLYGNEVDQHGLAGLLRNVLPKFPKLTSIDLGRNHISSLTDMAPLHDKKGKACQFSAMREGPSRLQKLQLKYNPIWYKNDPENQQALLGILQLHPQLGWLGDTFEDQSALCCPNILHQLDINRCGRILIDGKRHGIKVADSMWPLILERTNKVMGGSSPTTFQSTRTSPSKRTQQCRTANVIFHLISRGPAFADSCGGRQQSEKEILREKHQKSCSELAIKKKRPRHI